MSASRFNDLEQQLAHLRWRRWQNERNIRDKLTIGKSMREKVCHLVLCVCVWVWVQCVRCRCSLWDSTAAVPSPSIH